MLDRWELVSLDGEDAWMRHRPRQERRPTNFETVDFHALGGADTVTVNDLSGSDVTEVDTEPEGSPGSSTGDGQVEQMVVNVTNGDDAIAADRRTAYARTCVR